MRSSGASSRAVVLGVVLAVGLLGAAGAAAQDDDPASSRGTTFEAVEGPTHEDVAGAPLLVGAYGAILVLLILYVAWLGRLHTGSMQEIERLKVAIARAEKRPAEKTAATAAEKPSATAEKKTAEKDV